MRISTAALKVSPALRSLSTAVPIARACGEQFATAADRTANTEEGIKRLATAIRTPGGSPDCARSSVPAKKKPGSLAPARKMLQEKTNEEKMDARLHILHFRSEAYQLPDLRDIRQNPQNRRGNLRKNTVMGRHMHALIVNSRPRLRAAQRWDSARLLFARRSASALSRISRSVRSTVERKRS